MRPRIINRINLGLLLILPVVLAIYYLTSNPFACQLASRTINLDQYSREQRLNFICAAQALDGCVIGPNESFSFNRRVGPRTGKRGFMPAPSYLGASRVDSAGGGICLISSCLYQTALLAGLKVDERFAHGRVTSVAPGLDATVWYGQCDLKLSNHLGAPVELRAFLSSPNELTIQFLGDYSLKAQAQTRQLRRREIAQGSDLLVEVYLAQNANNQETLVSRDRYRIR